MVIGLNDRAARVDASLQVQEDCIRVSDADSDQRLHSVLARVLTPPPGQRAVGQSVRIPRPGRRPLALRVLPLADGSDRFRGARAMVLVFDPDDTPRPDEALVREIFGLTPAEWRIAERLIGGDSLADIAAALDVTVSTVRTQLKSIFAKTQSHRQTELVASLIHLTGLSSGPQEP